MIRIIEYIPANSAGWTSLLLLVTGQVSNNKLVQPAVVLSHQPHDYFCLTGARGSILNPNWHFATFIIKVLGKGLLRVLYDTANNLVAIDELRRLEGFHDAHCFQRAGDSSAYEAPTRRRVQRPTEQRTPPR
jgi:hypothetical protein